MRQHATPLLIGADDTVALTPAPSDTSEATIQALIHAYPSCLPIAEIDPMFVGPIAICTELNTPAGPIDNLLVTPGGLPVLVECKLWRNPQARGEVVGQILDYAKELSRWSSSDLQREASRRLGREGNTLLELVRAHGHDVDEIAFNDALTLNLRRGRFLLLIVGDGIREGVEAIAEYLQAHAGLHFTLGLVELPIYELPGGDRLVAPRVLARTALVTREVVAVPAGMMLNDQQDRGAADEEHPPLTSEEADRVSFMRDMLAGLRLDDPEQPIPRLPRKGWLAFYLPAPAASCYISILYKRAQQQIGLRLTSDARTIGEAAIAQVVEDWPEIERELGGTAHLEAMSEGRFRVHELRSLAHNPSEAERDATLAWMRDRINAYITAFRPRIRDAVAEITGAS